MSKHLEKAKTNSSNLKKIKQEIAEILIFNSMALEAYANTIKKIQCHHCNQCNGNAVNQNGNCERQLCRHLSMHEPNSYDLLIPNSMKDENIVTILTTLMNSQVKCLRELIQELNINNKEIHKFLFEKKCDLEQERKIIVSWLMDDPNSQDNLKKNAQIIGELQTVDLMIELTCSYMRDQFTNS